jgi:hypothetical protein
VGYIDFFGADEGTGPGGVAPIQAAITVQELQPFFTSCFPWVHQTDNAGHGCIGTDKAVVRTQASLGATKAIDAPGCLQEGFLVSWKKGAVCFVFAQRGRLNDVGLGLMHPGIGLFQVYNQISEHGSNG